MKLIEKKEEKNEVKLNKPSNLFVRENGKNRRNSSTC